IAANLALGKTLHEAIATSKKFVTAAIRESFALGRGIGPLNHFVDIA
ncbi:MAG: bifunctional hydroxymethylpyrimidine kinase/phosphomethylpyrimidine kinase, partial [Calditrichaeota bacterium]